MVTVPGPIPVTMPVPAPTVATAVVLQLHVPPGVASVSVIEDNAQTALAPTIGAGPALTVTIVFDLQYALIV